MVESAQRERREHDTTVAGHTIQIALLNQTLGILQAQCAAKEIKIHALEAFQNKAIGYSMAASAAISLLYSYIVGK